VEVSLTYILAYLLTLARSISFLHAVPDRCGLISQRMCLVVEIV